MTIKEVIKKAIEGGYKADINFLKKLPEYALCQVWLDPLFWQALGKGMGWDSRNEKRDNKFNDILNWRYYWHRFIDHLTEGGSSESYFESL